MWTESNPAELAKLKWALETATAPIQEAMKFFLWEGEHLTCPGGIPREHWRNMYFFLSGFGDCQFQNDNTKLKKQPVGIPATREELADPGPWFVLADPVWKDKHPLHRARYVATSTAVEVTGSGEDTTFHFVDPEAVIICTMPDSPNQEKNARLIAAAPKMVKALNLWLEQYGSEGTCPDREKRPEIIATREALAAVERGQQ